MSTYLVRRGEAKMMIRNLSERRADGLAGLLAPYAALTPVASDPGLGLWSVELCPRSSLPSGSLILAEGYEAAVTGRFRHLYVLTGADEARNLQSVLRVVRAALRRVFMIATPAFCLHAASVAVGGSANSLAIVGAKRSGKTSAVLTALKSGRFDYVTNDDLILTADRSAYIGHGWPRSVNIRKCTAEAFFPSSVVGGFAHPENALNEQVGRGGLAYPSELAELFSCAIVSQAKVAAFLFPEFGPKDLISPLAPAETAERLKAEVQISPSPSDSWMDDLFPELQNRHARVDLHRIGATVPGYAVVSRSLAGLETNMVRIGKITGML